MAIAKVKLKSEAPLLFNRRPLEDEDAMKAKGPEYNSKDQAEKKAWHHPEVGYFVPTLMIKAVLSEAGKKFSKGRSNYKTTIKECVQVKGDKTVEMDMGPVDAIPLGRNDYDAIDVRYCNQGGKSSNVPTARCRFDNWAIEFEVEYDEEEIKPAQLRTIFERAGRIGIGSYLYEFGRFQVDKFK
jgi:hypothetical protein